MRRGADVILLDNLRGDELHEAVGLVGGRARTEASGSVTLSNVAAIAHSGVDVVSLGWITHSVPPPRRGARPLMALLREGQTRPAGDVVLVRRR